MQRFHQRNLIWLTAALLGYGLLWLLTSTNLIDSYYQITLIKIMIDVIYAIGLNLVLGVAGVLYGLYSNQMAATMGLTPGLKAFVAAVVGGIGSIPGAMVGGYLIGLLETFVSAFGGSAFKDAAVYALLIVILLVLPAGLFGKNVKEKV